MNQNVLAIDGRVRVQRRGFARWTRKVEDDDGRSFCVVEQRRRHALQKHSCSRISARRMVDMRSSHSLRAAATAFHVAIASAAATASACVASKVTRSFATTSVGMLGVGKLWIDISPMWWHSAEKNSAGWLGLGLGLGVLCATLE